MSITQLTPVARLTSEYNVFVLPANSPFTTMKDVIEQMKKDPGSEVGRGPGVDRAHCGGHDCAREVGVDATKVNYVPFRGVARPSRGHPGRQCHHRWQRLQRVPVHRGRQDEADRRDFRKPGLKESDVPTLKGAGESTWSSATGVASTVLPASLDEQRKAPTDMREGPSPRYGAER